MPLASKKQCNVSCINMLPGRCILLEDWLGAVELILQPRKGGK